MDTKQAINQLFAPITASDFVEEYWPDNVFSTHIDLDQRPTLFRAKVLSGTRVLARSYHGSLSIQQGRKSPSQVAMPAANALDLLDMGLTVYLHDMTGLIPGTGDFLQQLEQVLGIRQGSITIGAFVSPKGDGLDFHYDAKEVISIQLIGSKEFHISPMLESRYPVQFAHTPDTKPNAYIYPQMTNGFPETDPQHYDNITMQPGSVLFMPRGTWHRTIATEDSLSISILIDGPSVAECIAEQLQYVLLQDEQWRRPLYGAWGSDRQRDEISKRLQQRLQELPQITKNIDAHHLLSSLYSDEQRLTLYSPESRFQRDPACRLAVEDVEVADSKPGIDVILTPWNRGYDGQTIKVELPGRCRDLINWLSSRRPPFSVNELAGQFPDFSDSQIEKVIVALARGRFLKMLWFAPMITD